MENDHNLPKIIMFNSHDNPTHSRVYSNAAKRLLDVIAASFGLFLLSPFLLIVSLLIQRESPGPVFYRGKRIGKNGKVFDILKFRTMVESPESHNGPRITVETRNGTIRLEKRG